MREADSRDIMDIQEGPGADPQQLDEGRRSFGEWVGDMPFWEKTLLGASVGAVIVGGVVMLSGGDVSNEPILAPASLPPGTIADSYTPEGTGDGALLATGEATVSEEPTSKGAFRLGSSFLSGFCSGLFLRSVLKLALVAVGFWVIATSLLGYAGLVVIDWNAIDHIWSQFVTVLGAEWGDFKRFMLGSLPATGLAVTGLAVGFKRH